MKNSSLSRVRVESEIVEDEIVEGDTKYELLPNIGGSSDFQMGKRIGTLESQNVILKWIVGIISAILGSGILFLLNKIDSTLINISEKMPR